MGGYPLSFYSIGAIYIESEEVTKRMIENLVRQDNPL